MDRETKRGIVRILIAAALFAAAMLIPSEGVVRLIIFLVPYAFIGWDVLASAAKNIARGQIFDENFLMCLATVGALAIGEYPEAVAVMLFYQIGDLFEDYAVGKSRRSISELMDIRPDSANLETPEGVAKVSPESVKPGDVIVVRPGEKVPLDGVLLEGASSLNTTALTGESMPRDIREGDDVISGCVNMSALIRVKVTKEYGESTAAKILELVETSSMNKARSEDFITRFARWYTPAVVIAAALLAVIPPLATGAAFSEWLHRALIFLVVSCPCALVISVPLSFFGGIGGASRQGVLVKGSNFLEALAKVDTVVMDKTGTLTMGNFAVTEARPVGMTREQLISLAAHAESCSLHPIALSLRNAYGKDIEAGSVGGVEELAGRGVKASVGGRTVCAGNARLMEEMGVAWREPDGDGTVVHVCADGEYAGYILIADQVKPGAKEALAQLKTLGIQKTVMLTGDTQAVGERVAKDLGLDEVRTQLLPQDKVSAVEALLAEEPKGGCLAFVGDGVNDAPVLGRADVGIAMGALGSDAAIEAADVVLMDDQLDKLPLAIRIARRTLGIVYQNIGFALAVKALVLALGALGVAGMWEAVFADVGVSVLAILNAMRALKKL